MKSGRGSAMLEFAAMLAVLSPILIGGLQFIQAFYFLHELEEGVRRAAEYGSRQAVDSNGFQSAVENMALYGGATEGGRTIVPGLKREHVRVEVMRERGRPARVRVSVAGYRIGTPGGELVTGEGVQAVFPYRR